MLTSVTSSPQMETLSMESETTLVSCNFAENAPLFISTSNAPIRSTRSLSSIARATSPLPNAPWYVPTNQVWLSSTRPLPMSVS
ncbi:hypothetical protein WICMUC_001134 [Wickerhamomyces mucosus]|nr:hypothetical protein WICMUC_001134 [Wickerhamomyces mucosus]